MIYETDAKKFAIMMKVTWQSYGRNNLDKDTLRYWFDKLCKHDLIDVEHAFDEWLKSQKELPTVSDILKLCQHKVTIHARLPSPLSKQANAEYAKEVLDYVKENITPKRDLRDWAHKILASPKGRQDIAIRFAKEALNIN